MTRIDFYTNVADPQAFACRLAQTVYKKRERLFVWLADEAAVDAFSTRLWCLGDTVFVPHCRAGADEAPDTPIWLSSRLPAGDLPEVLLNLGPSCPEPPDRFGRILEIVGRDEPSLAVARERFRRYRELGFFIEHHDMSHLSS